MADDPTLIMYRKGFVDALACAEAMAREDHRVSLAKECGLVPRWQRAIWEFADRLAAFKAEREKLLNSSTTEKK